MQTLCGPDVYARALLNATRTVPLARPVANIQGISILSPELDGKRVEIPIEAVPGARRLTVGSIGDSYER